MVILFSGWFVASVYAALVPWMAIAFRWQLSPAHALIGAGGLISMFVCLWAAEVADDRQF